MLSSTGILIIFTTYLIFGTVINTCIYFKTYYQHSYTVAIYAILAELDIEYSLYRAAQNLHTAYTSGDKKNLGA